MSFGESIKYDYGFSNPKLDGKMAGIVWRGASDLKMFAYGYSYTPNLSLKKADFAYSGGGLGWNNADLDYTVSDLYYDKNGNITKMKQRGQKAGEGPVDMDILGYTYEPQSNRLQSVKDDGIPDYGAGDFRDGNTNGADYDYDANGNLIADRNRGVKTEYTRFNKPFVITKNDGTSIEYTYDAAGNRLEEITDYELKDYIGNCVYNTGWQYRISGDRLNYILTSEGRTVFDGGEGIPIREEFFVKDHLGNVRSVVSQLTYNTRNYLASYELASANLEGLVFNDLDDVRDLKPGGSGDNTMAANLNGMDAKRRIGSSLLVHVMAGDKVSMNVNTYYNGYKANEEKPITADMALTSITNALKDGIGGFAGEGHNTNMVNAAFSPANYSIFSKTINDKYTDPSKPRAYLNYVLFDENMKVISNMSGAFQANGAGAWAEVGTVTPMEVPQNGYLALYLSNSSQQVSSLASADVYFDQLRFTVTKGALQEETHYYPFGLPMAGLSSTVTDVDFKENPCKYQGNELIKALDLNLMDFHARQYDPQIGRFQGVDPLAAFNGQDMFSPYAAMGNMPEHMIDPNGLSFKGHSMSSWSPSSPDGGSGSGGYAGAGRTGGSHTEEMNPPSLTGIGGFDPGFSGMGLAALSINTFWNITTSSVKAQICGDYTSYVRHKQAEADAPSAHVEEDDDLSQYGIVLPVLPVQEHMVDWTAWGQLMEAQFDKSLGWDFNGYGEESNWYANGGKANWIFGGGLSGIEGFSGIARFGSNMRFYGATANGGVFLGNQYVKTYSIAKAASRLGYVAAGIGFVMDGIGVWNYYQNPNSSNAVHPSKAGVNTGMSVYGLFVNPAASMLYFGIDAFYPGGWMGDATYPGAIMDQDRLYQENRAINPDWKLWPAGSKQ